MKDRETVTAKQHKLPPLARRLGVLALAAVFMVAFIESVRAFSAWWKGDAIGLWEGLLALLLPLLIAIYFRYFSVLSCDKGKCLPPPEPPGSGH